MIRRLRDAAKLMKDVKTLYRDYPAVPENLERWKTQVRKMFDETSVKLE